MVIVNQVGGVEAGFSGITVRYQYASDKGKYNETKALGRQK